LRELKPFDCGRPVAVDAEAVVVHRGLYQSRPGCLGRALDGLQRRGYREAARDGEITLYRRVE